MAIGNRRDAFRVASSTFIEAFFRVETAGGLLLLVATACALFWANSPWSASYEDLWHGRSAHFLVNDVLMSVFFLVVGLEIRREIHDGALSSPRQAALPVAAALGGIAVPAAIYLLLNAGDPLLRRGWAVPTATDIAFAVGALALLGKSVQPALRVLLLTIAIADDVAAILVIALFYADGIGMHGMAAAIVGVACVLALRRARVRSAFAYLLAGAVIWLGLLHAGLHPVLAGVLLGLLVPAALAEQLEARLHSLVAYGVMPMFALANAGIAFAGLSVDGASLRLAGGVVLALVVGKPAGIVAAAALAVRLRLCRLPTGVGWAGVAVVGCLGGIGFTMSTFIATLAFADPAMLAAAKLGVLAGSLLAGAAALTMGRCLLAQPRARREPGVLRAR